MIDALFWWTGLAFWLGAALAALCWLAADANDRRVRDRALARVTR
jgi:hypothetical protein